MNVTIGIVGLGYVGLPLAVALSKHFPVIGFDTSSQRIEELQTGYDHSHEIDKEQLQAANITFTVDPHKLKESNFIIVCVPTPITKAKRPDLSYIESASKIIGQNLSVGSIIVYESTVYPGVTEDVCLPLLEHYSGLKCPQDFSVGYSPERMNPGDKDHTIDKITKVVAGIDGDTTKFIASVYGKITQIHQSPNIKVAEAAKVIENIQRDLNIALMNELHIIFDKLNIDTKAVLEAAQTKWNFHPYHPGLVGGHCIGVDPYFLTYKAEELGYHPEVILAGRRINDNMHSFHVKRILKTLNKKGRFTPESKVLILGVTFKENVRDYRNSRVKHLISELKEYGITVYAHDPFVKNDIIDKKFGAIPCSLDQVRDVDLIVLTVNHELFTEEIKKIKENKENKDIMFVDVTFK